MSQDSHVALNGGNVTSHPIKIPVMYTKAIRVITFPSGAM
jgi:hypothetical protein